MSNPIDLSGWTFDEIAAKFGEEAAIQAGIAADPDTWELTDDDFTRMRPAIEVDPELVEQWRSTQGKQNSTIKNKLYFGDNLDILRNHVADASVDLIYLDPPFNSNANYNVLFQEKSGQQSAAQITAFEDTWHWSLDSESAYQDVVTNAPGKLPDLLQAMRSFLGENDMMAYLTMMAQRMVELHRVLKDTGNIYLHCDPTASHYLKLMMDAVFGAENFRNEIVWRRTGTHNKVQRFAPIHDVILFYSKTGNYKWKGIKRPYMKEHVEEYFVQDEHGWRTDYYGNVLTGSGTRGGESGKPWRGFDPTAKGRHWAIPRRLLEDVDEDMSSLSQHQKLERLYELGSIKIQEGHAWPVYEHYITPEDGQAAADIWAYQPYTEGSVFGRHTGIDADVRWLSTTDQERLGYPTQKPEALLERIVSASSNEGDLVLDPFCGCGTAIAAAERLNRRWIGIDITHIAITLIRHRLQDTFKDELKPYEVLGQPQDVASAQALATDSENSGRYQFEWWALGLVDARPAQDRKKGADSGIDGYINFFDDNSGKAKRIVAQVKSGHVTRNQIATLKGDMEREEAEIGLFITLREPTGPMRAEAASAGFYTPEYFPDAQYPRVQILTIEELLNGKRGDYPRLAREATFRQAPRRRRRGEQSRMV